MENVRDNQESNGPTREDNVRVSYLAQLDQDVASMAEKLKAAKSYQVTFTTVLPNGAVINHLIRNHFPNDIALKVHRECRDELIKNLEG